jgi:hypothetical protein
LAGTANITTIPLYVTESIGAYGLAHWGVPFARPIGAQGPEDGIRMSAESVGRGQKLDSHGSYSVAHSQCTGVDRRVDSEKAENVTVFCCWMQRGSRGSVIDYKDQLG